MTKSARLPYIVWRIFLISYTQTGTPNNSTNLYCESLSANLGGFGDARRLISIINGAFVSRGAKAMPTNLKLWIIIEDVDEDRITKRLDREVRPYVVASQ